MAGRLGARSIQLASESPLSFQLGMPAAPRQGGISDAMDAAIHTNLPAHPYTGARFIAFVTVHASTNLGFAGISMLACWSCLPSSVES